MNPLALRLRPLTNRVRRIARGHRELETVATRREVLRDREVERAPPLLYLPGELERATAGVAGYSTREQEVAHALAREFTHAPVIRYEFFDCFVHPGGVEAKGASYLFDRPPPSAFTSPVIRLEQACYCNTGASLTFFGHFLRDGCATALLARDGESILLDPQPGWANAGEYLNGLGLSPVQGQLFHVGRLGVFSDHAQGTLKRARYAEMRRRLERAYPGKISGPRRVYLRRGMTGARRVLSNEAEVISALSARGFDVVDVAGARAEDLLRRFRGVDMVVSIDGSHLNHLYFSLPKDAALCTIIPSDRFTMNQRGFAAALGLQYGFVVMTPAAVGHEVDVTRLMQTLDLFDTMNS